MAYTVTNYRTKKELRAAVADDDVPVFEPGIGGPNCKPGPVSLEGPHAPKAHAWYTDVTVVRAPDGTGRCVIPKGTRIR